jgi:hypothetical protein
MFATRERMAYSSFDDSGCLDNDFHFRRSYERQRIVGNKRRSVLDGICERSRAKLIFAPANSLQRGARFFRREIGDRDNVQTRGPSRLRKEHGAEFSGANEKYAYGIKCPSREQRVEIHAACWSITS